MKLFKHFFYISLLYFTIILIVGCSQNIQVDEMLEAMKNWKPPKINMSKEQIMKYYSVNRESLDPIEGIWIFSSVNESKFDSDFGHHKKGKNFRINDYKVAIIRNSLDDNKFNVISYESLKSSVNYGEIKGVFYLSITPKIYEYKFVSYSSEVNGNQEWITFTLSDDNNRLVGMWDTGIETDFMSLKSKFKISYIKEHSSFDRKDFKEEVYIGSGLLISESGLIVINYHVIEDKDEIEIFFPIIDRTTKAKVILKDKINDIAILRLNDFNFSNICKNSIPFTISNSREIKLGQDVFTLGFPLGEILGKSAKLSTGTINSLYGIQDDPRLFQISNPIQPGNSGGPLFNKRGELVGVVVSTLNAKYFYENADIIPQNVNFAIKSNYLLNLISMLPEEDKIIKRKNKLVDKGLENQIELLTPFIVKIKAK